MSKQEWAIGNGLELLDDLSHKCAALIILDLPYYGVVSDEWDNQWNSLEEYLDWCKEWFVKSERCLKDNGTLYYFNSQFKVIKSIDTLIESCTDLKFRQFITIDKGLQSIAGRTSEHLRSYPKASEYIVYYTFEDLVNNNSFLRLYFQNFQKALGLSSSEIVRKIGHVADHCFRWGSSQFELPTKETYAILCKLPFRYNFVPIKYEELRYPFNSMPGFADTWRFNFYKEKRYNHSTQKPFELIERIVLTSSNEGDLVIDPAMGTGTTLKVCKVHNRNFIGRELNEKYSGCIVERTMLHTPCISSWAE